MVVSFHRTFQLEHQLPLNSKSFLKNLLFAKIFKKI